MSILPISQGGTGTATPALVPGNNIALTNPFPNTTVSVSGVIGIANGGTGQGTKSFVDLSTAQTVGGKKMLTDSLVGTAASFSGSIAAGPGGINSEYINVKDHGTQHKSVLRSIVTIPNEGASTTITVDPGQGFLVSQLVSIWDYAVCFSATITGVTVNTVTVQCTKIFAGTANVSTLSPNGLSQFFGTIQTDDSAMITAALAAAYSQQSAILFFPRGSYVTSTTISLYGRISCKAEGAVIRPAGTVTDCFNFYTNFFGSGAFGAATIEIPSVYYFSLGNAIVLTDNAVSDVTIICHAIYKCSIGIHVKASQNGLNNSGSFVNVVQFHSIQYCSIAGIYMESAGGSNDIIQGFHFIGEIISNCLYGILFFTPQTASTTAAFLIPAVGNSVSVSLSANNIKNNSDYVVIYDGNNNFVTGPILSGGGTSTLTVRVDAGSNLVGGTMAAGARITTNQHNFNQNIFDVNAINGNDSRYSGIVYNGGLWTNQVFRVVSSFGSFGSGLSLITLSGGLAFGMAYELSLGFWGFQGSPNFQPPSYSEFSALASPSVYVASNNRLLALGAGPGSGGGSLYATIPYVAETVSNSRAAFNGGGTHRIATFYVTPALTELSCRRCS